MKWFRTPGFLMVVLVALVPPVLTGAWAWTHEADIAVTSIEWDPLAPEEGGLVNFTVHVENLRDAAVGPFNVTLRVGFYLENQVTGRVTWSNTHNVTERVEGLGGNAGTDVMFNWTSRPGAYRVEAWADWWDSGIKEREKLNNFRWDQIQVQYRAVTPIIDFPDVDENSTDEGRPEVNVTLPGMDWTPEELHERDNVTFSVQVHNAGPGDVVNASVIFQVHSISSTTGVSQGISFSNTTTVNVSAGATESVTFTYLEVPLGLYAAFAFVDTSQVAREDMGDNALIRQFDVQRRLVFNEPEEDATAKDFYRNQILLPVHFTLLVPLIGLFYAGGVLQDDRSRGNLVYMITRPIPRWQFPLVRFASSFGVALVAVLIGIVLTYFVLLSQPGASLQYLWWPLVFGMVVLFLYGSVFTLVGVISDRPYLVGLLYVLGFETLVLAGRRVLVNNQPLVQEWVLNLSLFHWVQKAFAGWDPAGPFRLLPQGSEAVTAFLVIIGIGVASLFASAALMRRREFA